MERSDRLIVTEALVALIGTRMTANLIDALTASMVGVGKMHTEKDGACEHCSFLAAPEQIPYPCPTVKLCGPPPCVCGKCEP